MFESEIYVFFFVVLSPFSLSEIMAQATVDYSEFVRTFSRIQNRGVSLRQKGDFLGAVLLFKEALLNAKNNDDKKGQLVCLMNLGVLSWNLGWLEASADFYTEALPIALKFGPKNLQDECIGALRIYETYASGKKLRSSGLYKESIAQFEAAIELARKIKSREHELKCLRQLSLNYFHLEAIKEFFILNNTAMEIAQRLNHKQEVGRCLNNIGLFYWKSNSYSKALVCYEESLAIAREFKNEKDESICLNNIGIIYKDIGNYDRSLRYFSDALSIDLRNKDDNAILIDLNNIGTIFKNRGKHSDNKKDFQLSLDYYLKSLEMSRIVQNKKLEIETLNNIGLVYATLGEFVSSIRYFRLAQRRAREINNIHELANICINTGDAYFHLGECEKSQKYFRRGLELSLKTGKNEILWEAYFGLAQCFEVNQQYSSALSCYNKATEAIDHIRGQLSLDDYKAGFARDKLKVYESLIHLLFMLKTNGSTSSYDDEIFQVIEKAKARAFLEGLVETDNSSLVSFTENLKKKQDEISKKITLTISRLEKPELPEDQRRILLERLEKEEDEYISLLNRIKSERQNKTGLTSFEGMSIREVQNRLLDRRTVVLEFFLGEKESFVFLITKTEFIVRSLPSRAVIENSLRAYLKMISTWPVGDFQGVPAAKRLYLELLGSFEEIISPVANHLIIVPDGILYYLPFETLISNVNERYPLGQYLIERYKISYSPSISSLVFLVNKKTEGRNSKSLLAIGNPNYSPAISLQGRPGKSYGEALREIYLNSGFELSSLPYTEREVLQISRCFPRGKVDTYLGAQASEDVVKNAPLRDYRIIHFACHGFQDEKSPLRAALVLSLEGNNIEDGFLQVREIYDLKLNADLVVLSACQTGRGKLEYGEGVLGLPRVFFYAGARSTISTLWKINDKSTSDLMRHFYLHLSAGTDKAQALRLAKLHMIKSGFSHPFFWAGFLLNGDHRSSCNPE